jgi:hypothetical protein
MVTENRPEVALSRNVTQHDPRSLTAHARSARRSTPRTASKPTTSSARPSYLEMIRADHYRQLDHSIDQLTPARAREREIDMGIEM